MIGPNGSGKSNLIEAISILKAAPGDLSAPIREGGGIAEWVWKGEQVYRSRSLSNFLHDVISLGEMSLHSPMAFTIGTVGISSCREMTSEITKVHRIRPAMCYAHVGPRECSPRVCLLESRGSDQERPMGNVLCGNVELTDIDPTQSILSQRKDPDRFPEITYLGKVFSQIYFFRNPNFGHRSPLARPATCRPADEFPHGKRQ